MEMMSNHRKIITKVVALVMSYRKLMVVGIEDVQKFFYGQVCIHICIYLYRY